MAASVATTVTGGVTIDAQFPAKFEPLLGRKARYKVFYGGRGGAKSWQFARALLLRGIAEPGLRVLCTREVQSSLKESVKQLLEDQIRLLGLEAHYRIMQDEIRGPGGTLFLFKGMSDPDALKSLEGVDVAWIEEARGVKASTWRKFDFTLRKSGAEIWISFNPELETDFIYDHFVKNQPPPDSIVVKVGYRDNPWLDPALVAQADHLKLTEYDEWLWAIDGQCKTSLDGAIYAKELRAATQGDRICRFGLVRGKPVHTFWDLGRSDLTAIWFVQMFGLENRVVRYYASNGEHISHYIEYLKALEAQQDYTLGTCWLPPDANEERLSSRRTTRQQIEDAHLKVRIVPKISIAEGIQAARTIFPNTYFHQVDAEAGVNTLRSYRYKVKDDGTRSKEPLHDWASNGADAFRYMGVALREEPVKSKPTPKVRGKLPPGRNSWMGR